MIDRTFNFSVAAAASPVNVMPSDFNPVPADGFMEVYAVSDPASGLTALPTLQFTSNASGTPQTPMLSVIPINTFGIAFTGPSIMNKMMSPYAVSKGTNTQLLLSGTNAGATATGRIRVVHYVTGEVVSSPT